MTVERQSDIGRQEGSERGSSREKKYYAHDPCVTSETFAVINWQQKNQRKNGEKIAIIIIKIYFAQHKLIFANLHSQNRLTESVTPPSRERMTQKYS